SGTPSGGSRLPGRCSRLPRRRRLHQAPRRLSLAYALRYRDDVVSLTTMEAPLPGTDYYARLPRAPGTSTSAPTPTSPSTSPTAANAGTSPDSSTTSPTTPTPSP